MKIKLPVKNHEKYRAGSIILKIKHIVYYRKNKGKNYSGGKHLWRKGIY